MKNVTLTSAKEMHAITEHAKAEAEAKAKAKAKERAEGILALCEDEAEKGRSHYVLKQAYDEALGLVISELRSLEYDVKIEENRIIIHW